MFIASVSIFYILYVYVICMCIQMSYLYNMWVYLSVKSTPAYVILSEIMIALSLTLIIQDTQSYKAEH